MFSPGDLVKVVGDLSSKDPARRTAAYDPNSQYFKTYYQLKEKESLLRVIDISNHELGSLQTIWVNTSSVEGLELASGQMGLREYDLELVWEG